MQEVSGSELVLYSGPEFTLTSEKLVIDLTVPAINREFWIILEATGNVIYDFAKIILNVCGSETIAATTQSLSLYFDYTPGETTRLGPEWIDALFDIGNIQEENAYCLQDFDVARGLKIFQDSGLTEEAPEGYFQILYDMTASSGLGYDVEILLDTFPGETLDLYVNLESHGLVSAMIPLTVMMGQNCFDVTYETQKQNGDSFAVIDGQ